MNRHMVLRSFSRFVVVSGVLPAHPVRYHMIQRHKTGMLGDHVGTTRDPG